MCVKSRDSNWEVPPRQIDCCLISEPDSLVGYGSKLTPRSPPVASLATYEVICACNLVGTMVHAPTRPLDFVSTGQVLRQRGPLFGHAKRGRPCNASELLRALPQRRFLLGERIGYVVLRTNFDRVHDLFAVYSIADLVD